MADEVLLQGVQGITDLITTPGLINTDFADVKMIMSDAGSRPHGRRLRDRARAVRSRPPAPPSPRRCSRPPSTAPAASCSTSPAAPTSPCSRSTRPPRSSTRWPTPRPTSSSAPSSTTRWATRCASPSSPPGSSAGTTRSRPPDASRPRPRADLEAGRAQQRRHHPRRLRRRGRRVALRAGRRLRRPVLPEVAVVADPDGRLDAAVAASGGSHGPARRVHVRFTDRTDGDLAVDADPDRARARPRRRRAGPLDVAAPGARGGRGGGRGRPVSTPGPRPTPRSPRCPARCWPCRPPTAPGCCSPGRPVGCRRRCRPRRLARPVRGCARGHRRRRCATSAPSRCTGASARASRRLAYEFGGDDLDRVADRLGDVVGRPRPTAHPALDLRAGVAAALDAAGAKGPADPAVACTASDPRFHSWRARQDAGRQAAVIWSTVTSAHTR